MIGSMKTSYLLLCLLVMLFFSCQNASTEVENAQAMSSSPSPDSALTAEKKEPIIFDSTNYKFKDGLIEIDWALLSRIEFDEQYNEEVQAYIPYPVFDPVVKALAGKTVIIKGYVIPIEETSNENIIVLSAFPYSNCFFCGGAGPESVMDILAQNPSQKFNMDEQVSFKGRLKLNDTDLFYLNYILDEAVAYE